MSFQRSAFVTVLSRTSVWRLLFAAFLTASLSGCDKTGSARDQASNTDRAKAGAAPVQVELLNASYDPTRELWRQVNERFVAVYRQQAAREVTIKQSHGGSGSQARAVIDGLEADVVTLAIWSDIDAIRKAGLIANDWQQRLPHNSLPYFSTIVFVVRKGNPHEIKDWSDLVRPGVEIITPSPKTSGNGKLSFLAAWGSVVRRGGSDVEARQFVTELYRHTPVLDTAARAATTTFAQKGIGDVHLTWENEAVLEVAESAGQLQIVYPSISIRAEPFVALVDANVDRKLTRDVAEAYLRFLYTPEAQKIIAENGYRPIEPAVLSQHSDKFPELELFKISEIAAGWSEANDRFFAERGLFDQIYESRVE
jgi:sulfate/thiosulfate transport system substrate-binding protein